MSNRRFKIGDRVSIKYTQSTGHNKRFPVYGYGTIVERPASAPTLPMHGGFHYVLEDGASSPELRYVGKLHHLDSTKVPA